MFQNRHKIFIVKQILECENLLCSKYLHKGEMTLKVLRKRLHSKEITIYFLPKLVWNSYSTYKVF